MSARELASSATEDAFEILRIAPTLDAASIKRAYFAAIARSGPQRDPARFVRVRAAYERLSTPAGIATAYLAAPVDAHAALVPLRARFDALLERELDAHHAARDVAETLRSFVKQTSKLSWRAALERFG